MEQIIEKISQNEHRISSTLRWKIQDCPWGLFYFFIHHTLVRRLLKGAVHSIDPLHYCSISSMLFFNSIILSRNSAACSKFRSAAAARICFSTWAISAVSSLRFIDSGSF